MTISTQAVEAALHILQALAEAIHDLREVPAGHLYAQVCSKLTLQDFDAAIARLVGADLVRRNGDVLRWVGPV
jgi:hypothetical protein